MSHTYDVIYAQFKKGAQNRSEILFSKQKAFNSISTKSEVFKYPYVYFLRKHKVTKTDQKRS